MKLQNPLFKTVLPYSEQLHVDIEVKGVHWRGPVGAVVAAEGAEVASLQLAPAHTGSGLHFDIVLRSVHAALGTAGADG